MGFHFRKSFSSGPFRINLSKNGFSYSFGIKGARINSGPRGTYVTIGSNGIYYRKKIQSVTSNQQYIHPVVQQHQEIHTITSGNIVELTDVDSKEFIDELTEKAKKISYVNWFGIFPFAVFLILHYKLSAQNAENFTFINPYFILIAGIILFVFLIYWLSKKDRERLSMEIHYEMNDQLAPIYEQFENRFSGFNRCDSKWQYLHTQNNMDLKRNAGAGTLVDRIPIIRVSAHKSPSKFLKTNVKIPHIKLRNTELFFLPERLLIRRGNQFAAVFYQNLEIDSVDRRFIEDARVPSDAQIVDHTWKYVNKKGGPDKRFNDNKKLPICLYTAYTIKSDTGIYEIITTSKIGGFDAFANYLREIGALQSRMRTKMFNN